MHSRDALQESPSAQTAAAPESAASQLDLELTLTFEPESDPFALATDEKDLDLPPVVIVRLNNVEVSAIHEGIAPGVPWLKEDIEGVVLGTNELFIEATPPIADIMTYHAVRVRLLEDGREIADRTFWSQSGENVIGTLRFEKGSDKAEREHDHW